MMQEAAIAQMSPGMFDNALCRVATEGRHVPPDKSTMGNFQVILCRRLRDLDGARDVGIINDFSGKSAHQSKKLTKAHLVESWIKAGYVALKIGLLILTEPNFPKSSRSIQPGLRITSAKPVF